MTSFVGSTDKAFNEARDFRDGMMENFNEVIEEMHYMGESFKQEMIDTKDYPDLDMTNSEHIMDYEYEYQYCLNISFNEDAVPGKGSAIFLHCLGPLKPYTGGCVAIPENIMKIVMQKVTPDCVVVIDTFENMGGTF